VCEGGDGGVGVQEEDDVVDVDADYEADTEGVDEDARGGGPGAVGEAGENDAGT